MPSVPLEAIAHAAATATRAPVDEIRRRTLTRAVFLALARDQGWIDRSQLARACGVTPQSILRAWERSVPDFVLHAARLCLADPRLSSSARPNASSRIIRAS